MAATACPSGRCREGALLIGVVRSDGSVAYLGGPLEVDADFVATASTGRTPETRFRFSEPCAQGACGNWGEGRCDLVGELAALGTPPDDAPLPRCGIRASCVWFAQEQAAACRVCPAVVRTV